MPQDEETKSRNIQSQLKPTPSPWLTTPKPIKRLFDNFPLVTYPANELPTRNPVDRSRNTLYIFARDDDARNGSPSFNPSCLKWQTYLLFTGIPFTTQPSSNHASPTGSLPFLLPASSSSNPDAPTPSAGAPIPSSKLQEWAAKTSGDPTDKNKTQQPPNPPRHQAAYVSLLDNRIRNAWLHTLYLSPRNFSAVARPLYIAPATAAPPARFSLARTLRAAALEELVKSGGAPVVDADTLYRASDAAFAALSQLLGADEWFFGAEAPGLMDAGVFAYTHLLLNGGMMGWKEEDERMGRGLRDGRWRNLVEHRGRILERFYRS
ncbi:MAG: hypothetical protein LQ344_000972 [Seirophora lacunosa]|nr:MAG: hypothetical protein LQ344_000972 [Seirophora lacunosa]